MFRIAICDNEQEEIDALCACVRRWMDTDGGHEGEIETFTSSSELYERLKNENAEALGYDVFLLDIMMPKIDGIVLGKQIRELRPRAIIIYTTSSPEFAMEAYGVQAISYLLKPVEQEKLNNALSAAFILCRAGRYHEMIVSDSNTTAKIVIEDILYIENQVRTLSYVMADGTVVRLMRRAGTFEEAVGSLVDWPCFIQTHKSYFINMSHVRNMLPEHAVMDNGIYIPITRRRRQEVSSRYLDFLAGGGV